MEALVSGPVGPECDEEGFPVASLRRVGHGWQIMQDEESGEWVQQQVFVLRHQGRISSSFLPDPRPRLVQEVVHIHWPLVDRGQIFQDYEHTMSSRLSENLASAQDNTHIRRPARPAAQHSGLHTFKSRPMFQVPLQVFQELPQKDLSSGGTKICITIWKEFLYAPSVLMLERQHFTHSPLHGIKPITCRLQKFFNPSIVNWSLYAFFFGVYFLYCCIFHDLLEIGLYLLFGNHLSIHHLANCSNIDVKFEGSFFVGPAYALIRMCCQHCAQKGNAEVMWRHMAKMRKDIMNVKVK